jgi:hypothetical protein
VGKGESRHRGQDQGSVMGCPRAAALRDEKPFRRNRFVDDPLIA